jgi:hypothetical protein
MGELKPIGSEKLKGDEKLKRILELTYYKPTDESAKTSEVIKESTTGVYGIVKEKDGYYVKRGLNENSLDYIGGLYMKNKNRFSSYGEAFKKLQFLTEQDNLQEATKYILKRPAPPTPAPAPQAEAPAPMPTNDPATPSATPDPTSMDTGDAGTPPPTGGEDDLSGENGSEGAPEDPVKIIQTKTGKLTQKLSQFKDDLKSEDIKYVLNMVLGAVDLDKMDEKDKDAILSKLEGDENGEGGEGEGGEEDLPPMNDMAKQTAEDSGGMGSSQVGGIGDGDTDDETGGIDPMDSLEELINNPFEDDDFTPYDDEDDEEVFDLGPEDYKATKTAQHDISKEREGMDDDTEDDDVEYGRRDAGDEEVDEMGSGDDLVDPNNFGNGETTREPGDDIKELDIDELNDIVTTSVKETLSKYFSE